MSEASIRARIKERLESVDGIGIVHDYERWAMNWNDILDKFKTPSNRYHGWMISRTQRTPKQSSVCGIEVAHTFRIRGIYALDDAAASEKTFQSLIDNISLAFDADETLNGTCLTTHPDFGPLAGTAGLIVDQIDMRMFGNVLCHYAECRLGAVEKVYVADQT